MEVTARILEHDVLAVRLRTQNTSGRTATLWLSKVGDIKIRDHCPIPDEADIKEVTLQQEATGEWFVSFGLETDEAVLPEKPDVDSLDASNSVGIDLGILNYIHTSDGTTVEWLEVKTSTNDSAVSNATSRRRKRGRTTTRSKPGMAKVKRHIRRKVLDYQHKMTTWLVCEYDAVFVENLNMKWMVEQSPNARYKQDAAWRQFITLLGYEPDLYGCHVNQAEARGTPKECASCGVETAKSIWVRKQSARVVGLKQIEIRIRQ